MTEYLCAGLPLADEIFHSEQPKAILAGKSICKDCPARQQCLDAELDSMRAGIETHGVYGGTSKSERIMLVGPAVYNAARKERSRNVV